MILLAFVKAVQMILMFSNYDSQDWIIFSSLFPFFAGVYFCLFHNNDKSLLKMSRYCMGFGVLVGCIYWQTLGPWFLALLKKYA